MYCYFLLLSLRIAPMLLFATLIKSSNGCPAGQVNKQQPHSMQSIAHSFSASSQRCCLESNESCIGSKPIGQAETHLPQRRQLVWVFLFDSFSVITNMLEVVLTVGASILTMAFPIIGPPLIILPVLSGSPPQ